MVCLFELLSFEQSSNYSNTPPFREKSLIIVFHRIWTPELKLFNFVRIIRVIMVHVHIMVWWMSYIFLLWLMSADVNECSRGTDRCHLHATCRNIQGSYTCSCNTGYTGNGFSCTGMLVVVHGGFLMFVWESLAMKLSELNSPIPRFSTQYGGPSWLPYIAHMVKHRIFMH